MWTNHGNHIRIFFDAPRNGPGGSEKTQENRDIVDKTKIDALTKEMLEGFLKEPSRQKAMNFLSKYLKGKEKELQNNPTLLKALKERESNLGVLSNYNGYIFGESPGGTQKEIPVNRQKDIKNLLLIPNVTVDFSRTKGSEKVTNQEVQSFVKNHPLETYTSEWIQTCLENPEQIQSGLRGKLARKTEGLIFGAKSTHSLQKELKNLVSLGAPSEYISVIKTLINTTSSPEFGKYTGQGSKVLQAATGHSKDTRAFQENFRTFATLSARQKRELTKEDFDHLFDEKRELSNEEINKADQYGKVVFNQVLESDPKNISQLLKQRENELSQDKTTSKALTDRKKIVLNTIKGIAQDERVRDQFAKYISDIGNLLGDKKRTQEAFLQNAYIAIQSSAKNGRIVNVKVEDGEYKVEDFSQTVQKIKSDIRTLNAELMKKYLASVGNDFGRFEKELGKDAIAAIGNYLKNKPDTQLFQGAEKAKGFFLQTYSQLIQRQGALLERKKEMLSGKFDTLFPNLMQYPEIANSPEIQKRIKEKDIGGAYDLLAGKISNGRMAKIMETLEKDAANLESESRKKLTIESEKWRGKTLKDANIVTTTKEDAEHLKKIISKNLSTGSLSSEDIEFLLRIVPKGHQLRIFIELYNQVEFGGSIKAQAVVTKRLAQKEKPTDMSKYLSTRGKEALFHADRLGSASSMNVTNQGLYKTNSESGNEEQKRQYMETKTNNDRIVATSIAALAKNPELSREDQRDIARTVTGSSASDEQIDKWIDTQVFLSKYVEEKNFVDMVEKNAAYMNLGESKSIGELYGMNKVDISNMSSDSGSVKLGETSIMGHNSFAGMNALMNCRVEVGGNGVFSRTIRTPEGQIIAENIPLENISTTIEQLGRFYTIGLGPLVPRMKEVNNYISKVRPDAIGGTDGTYGITEDEKFLKIMAIMLYGDERLPGEKNIPNLIRVFNQPGRENEPSFILKQKGILTETGGVNSIKLEEQLKTASAKI